MRAAVALALAASTLAVAPPAFADLDDFEFESFQGVYELGRDGQGVGTLRVEETLIAIFPDYDQNRGLARLIPRSYRGVDLETRILSVTDGTNPRDYSVSERGAFVEVESVLPEGSYARGPQRYDISYTQRGVIGEFSDSAYQEFYWDINGTGWPQFFGVVGAEIVIPAELVASLVADRAACYVGETGSGARCEISRIDNPDGSARFIVAHEGVFPYESVTVAIGFQPDTFVVEAPPPGQRWFVGLSFFAGSLLVIALVSVVLLRRGPLRDEPGRPVVIAEYLPPANVSLGSAAHLLGQPHKLPPALLIDLAVTGAIHLLEGEKKNHWRLQRTNTVLTPEQEAGLAALLGSIPAAGATVDLPRGPSSAAAARMNQFAQTTKKATVAQGLYRSAPVPLSVIAQAVFGVLGALIVLVSLTGDQGFLWFPPDEAPGLVAFGLFVAGVAIGIVPIAVLSRKPLSSAGAEARDHLRGLRLYIQLAEKDRLAYLQSPQGALRERVDAHNPVEVLKLYERLLPWAIVLGVDTQWLKVLQSYYDADRQPGWLVTPRTISLVDALSSISQQTRSSYQSSSSSGSGGGGSAGGGGGGGGGGGR